MQHGPVRVQGVRGSRAAGLHGRDIAGPADPPPKLVMHHRTRRTRQGRDFVSSGLTNDAVDGVLKIHLKEARSVANSDVSSVMIK